MFEAKDSFAAIAGERQEIELLAFIYRTMVALILSYPGYKDECKRIESVWGYRL